VNRPRLGIVIDQEVTAGGGWYQGLSTAFLFLKYGQSWDFIFFVGSEEIATELRSNGAESVVILKNTRGYNFFSKLLLSHPFLLSIFLKYSWFRSLSFETCFLDYDIELLWYTSPNPLAAITFHLPFVYTLWDMCHRDFPEFSEVRAHGLFEMRDFLYSKILPKAVGVVVSSDFSKSQVIKRYGLDEERVHVVQFQPAQSIFKSQHGEGTVESLYGILGPYIFYPAQFWGHKNHWYILQGLQQLKAQGVSLKAVFCGSDRGNLAQIKQRAEELGVGDQVLYLGFVPDAHIPLLYRDALALVMPTFFGPTNIPPLEAMYLGVPVLYTDAACFHEDVGDNVFWIDLNDPSTMVNHLLNIIQQTRDVQEKVAKAQKWVFSARSDDVVWISIETVLQKEFGFFKR